MIRMIEEIRLNSILPTSSSKNVHKKRAAFSEQNPHDSDESHEEDSLLRQSRLPLRSTLCYISYRLHLVMIFVKIVA